MRGRPSQRQRRQSRPRRFRWLKKSLSPQSHVRSRSQPQHPQVQSPASRFRASRSQQPLLPLLQPKSRLWRSESKSRRCLPLVLLYFWLSFHAVFVSQSARPWLLPSGAKFTFHWTLTSSRLTSTPFWPGSALTYSSRLVTCWLPKFNVQRSVVPREFQSEARPVTVTLIELAWPRRIAAKPAEPRPMPGLQFNSRAVNTNTLTWMFFGYCPVVMNWPFAQLWGGAFNDPVVQKPCLPDQPLAQGLKAWQWAGVCSSQILALPWLT